MQVQIGDEFPIKSIINKTDFRRTYDELRSGDELIVVIGLPCPLVPERMATMRIPTAAVLGSSDPCRMRLVEVNGPEEEYHHFVAYYDFGKSQGFVQLVSEDSP